MRYVRLFTVKSTQFFRYVSLYESRLPKASGLLASRISRAPYLDRFAAVVSYVVCFERPYLKCQGSKIKILPLKTVPASGVCVRACACLPRYVFVSLACKPGAGPGAGK